jgi:hypothetical protein
MLSEAKHLSSYLRQSIRIKSEILRFAQNDKYEMTCFMMGLLAPRLTPVVIFARSSFINTSLQRGA